MPILTDPSLLSYNGVEFTTFFATKVSGKPILDTAQRAVKYVQFTIEATGKVVADVDSGDTNINTQMEDMLNRLTRPGGNLEYNGKGFGDGLVLNTPGQPVKDAKWGPIPELLDFQPLGGGANGMMAAMVTWRVVCHVPKCEEAKYEFALCELTFNQAHEIDDDGYSTISTSGVAEMPMTRDGIDNFRPPDHIDRLREKVLTKVPIGFMRRQSFRFSDDKRTMTFSWTDTQVRETPPPGCTKAPLIHRMRSKGPAYVEHTHTLSGTITLPPNVPKNHAIWVFLSAAYGRMRTLNTAAAIQGLGDWLARESTNAAAASGGGGGFAGFMQGANPLSLGLNIALNLGGAQAPLQGSLAGGGVAPSFRGTPVVIPRDFEVANGPTERSVNFSLLWTAVYRGLLPQVVSASGVWQPLTPGSATDWHDSMARLGVHHVRGPSQVVFRKEDDALLDLCPPHPTPPPIQTQKVAKKTTDRDLETELRFKGRTPGDRPPPPGGGRPPFFDVETTTEGDIPGRVPSVAPNTSDFPGFPTIQKPPGTLAPGLPTGITDPGGRVPNLLEGLPSPEATWILYEPVLAYEEPRGRFARHQPLNRDSQSPDIEVDGSGPAHVLRTTGGHSPASATTNKADVLQEVTVAPSKVWLMGTAIKMGEPPPLPNLLSVRGAVARLHRVARNAQEVIARWGTIPIWRLVWVLEYYLDQPPTGLPALANPVLGVDGG